MHLVTNPTRFDVILTENLFGASFRRSGGHHRLARHAGLGEIGGAVDFMNPFMAPRRHRGARNREPVGAIASAALLLRTQPVSKKKPKCLRPQFARCSTKATAHAI